MIFFFNDPAPTEIYTLSLHGALPISGKSGGRWQSGASILLPWNLQPISARCANPPILGQPLGPTKFITGLEQTTLRALAPRKGGRPKKPETDGRQDGFPFIA